jgi:predicted phosphodiesterase
VFSILHISDLHRTPNAKISNAELLSALLSDRDSYTRGGQSIRAPDAIVVSGDVVQGVPLKASKSQPTLQNQYEEAEAFLCDLAEEMVDGDRSKVIIVPGNHDIDWQVAKSAMQLVEFEELPKDVLGALQEQDSLFRFSWNTREVFRIVDQERYDTRFDAFWRFFESYYAGTSGLLRVQPRSDANIFSLHAGRIGVAAFNSCHGNDCFAFHGAIPAKVIAQTHLDMRALGPFELSIAVWHHNLEGPPYRTDYMDIEIVRAMIGRGFRVGMYGHQHRSQISAQSLRLAVSETMAILGTGALCAGSSELPNGSHRQYSIVEIGEPKILASISEKDYSMSESALMFRLSSIVSSDYFVTAEFALGHISHQLPIFVQDKAKPIRIVLEQSSPTLQLMKSVYEKEYGAFEHMVKDFVRNIVFPKISHLVPSATRQGAEAFLKTIQRNREVFEYEYDDVESLTKVWQDYLGGKITQPQAAARANVVTKRSHQVLDVEAKGSVSEVVPDVIENEQSMPVERDVASAQPPIERLDIETARKLLTIENDAPALRGYRCFLALTDRIREERGDFFLQPHRTSIVWGGQKALFIFEHHSGDFGLYYEIQTALPVSVASGGGSVETCTIVMKNRIFIPIPPHLEPSFVPDSGEKKRLDVRCELLFIDRK